MTIISSGDSPIDANTVDGTELAARLNRLYPAIGSNHANATRPPYVTAGGLWTKFTSPSTYELYFYNGTTDRKIEPGSYLPSTGGFVTGSVDISLNLNIGGLLIVGAGANSSNIYMSDSDENSRVIHCNGNRVGFLNQAGAWGAYCNDAGDWICDTRMTCANAPTLGTDLANKDYVDTKLTASTYTAADILTKIKTVDGSGSGLDADTLDGYQASAFLIGTTWIDMGGSRVAATDYTNSTGKTIQLSVKITLSASGGADLYVNGTNIASYGSSAAGSFTFTHLIPPGATYKISGSGSVLITSWKELI
jgi:hypothetical protein